jgi:NAD(P)-dependent dehydrogenase (short-subunit alcohol dehydrogenase family)
MKNLCKDRVVIVTGAARGIGREYAMQLAEYGAKVIVNDIGTGRDGNGHNVLAAQEVVDEIIAAGGQALANNDDISSWVGSKALVDAAINHFGGLDVLVNNAGILRDRMMVNMEESEWDAVINVHLKGTFAPAHHAAVYWRTREKETGIPVNARIINTTSASGVFGNIGQSNYGAAKAGIAAMTIITARELKRYGITVNAICPHAQTRMTEGIRERTPEEIEARHPRWISPLVVWLASDQSSEVTGRVFEVGGGFLAVLEGWHRGPEAEPISDPDKIGATILDLSKRARRNADMKGNDLD